MDWSVFSAEGFQFLFRWFHIFFGVIWIGLLYYFNFVQGEYFKETDPAAKTAAIQKLVPRALWWFRWAAKVTFITGWTIILMKGHTAGHEIYMTSWGILILTGAILGTIMYLNVWLVIWPNQKVVIAKALGQPTEKDAAICGAKAALASRTNVLFSIPMLFFMGAASHLPVGIDAESSMSPLVIALAVIIGGLEWNGLKGKLGPMTTVKGVITCGFVLAVVLYGLVEVLL